MRHYKINRNLESTPQVWGLRTPDLLAIFLVSAIFGLVLIIVFKSLVWTLVILAICGGIFHWLRTISDDTNMNVRVTDQPERIEGYREIDV